MSTAIHPTQLLERLNPEPAGQLLQIAEAIRQQAGKVLGGKDKQRLGQFFTPHTVAGFMASLARPGGQCPSVLDPGAGSGILAASLVEKLISAEVLPESIDLVVVEIDPKVIPYLQRTMQACRSVCESAGIGFTYEIKTSDFLKLSSRQGSFDHLANGLGTFDYVIMNPPYRRINSSSEEFEDAANAGIRTSNLYPAFMYLAARRLRPGGQFISITPRSFCNGPYFMDFRQRFLDQLYIEHIHLFDSRDRLFAEGDVLQENVILSATRRPVLLPFDITISTSMDQSFDDLSVAVVPYEQVVRRKESLIHIPANAGEQQLERRFAALGADLRVLKLEVSTGRVVDFRVPERLLKQPTEHSVPLLYPHNLREGRVVWPLHSVKPQALKPNGNADDLLIPSGCYVLVKRFSAKEEKKRIVASVLEPGDTPSGYVALENHLNFFHVSGHGMDRLLAYGLVAFLNSSYVDAYFRQFSGHTQVNASDLRRMKYPSRETLERIGALATGLRNQDELDKVIAEEVFHMTEGSDLIKLKGRIDEAVSLLQTLGLPREQLNERSALALLALLDLKPDTPWAEAQQPLLGITEMMEWFAAHYHKQYAPNTRETVRRYSIHQFVQAGLADYNPDDRSRPTNSPNAVYQITGQALSLLRSFGSPGWADALRVYLKEAGELRLKYAKERDMARIAVRFPGGSEFELSPGGQNDLIKAIIEEFCPLFAPGSKLMYVGDTAAKAGLADQEALRTLGFEFDSHGKMPDVIVYRETKNWLYLIEAVTSHGPVSHKRHVELAEMFKPVRAGLIFITAFPDHKTLSGYLGEVAWETEVWVATHPTHIVHFDGERFLGPYED